MQQKQHLKEIANIGNIDLATLPATQDKPSENLSEGNLINQNEGCDCGEKKEVVPEGVSPIRISLKGFSKIFGNYELSDDRNWKFQKGLRQFAKAQKRCSLCRVNYTMRRRQ